jgi:hypothetical protein
MHGQFHMMYGQLIVAVVLNASITSHDAVSLFDPHSFQPTPLAPCGTPPSPPLDSLRNPTVAASRAPLRNPTLPGAAHHPPDARPNIASPCLNPPSCDTLDAADLPAGRPGRARGSVLASRPVRQRRPSLLVPSCSSSSPVRAKP